MVYHSLVCCKFILVCQLVEYFALLFLQRCMSTCVGRVGRYIHVQRGKLGGTWVKWRGTWGEGIGGIWMGEFEGTLVGRFRSEAHWWGGSVAHRWEVRRRIGGEVQWHIGGRFGGALVGRFSGTLVGRFGGTLVGRFGGTLVGRVRRHIGAGDSEAHWWGGSEAHWWGGFRGTFMLCNWRCPYTSTVTLNSLYVSVFTLKLNGFVEKYQESVVKGDRSHLNARLELFHCIGSYLSQCY